MIDITRREFMKSGSAAAFAATALDATQTDEPASPPGEMALKSNWLIQSSVLVDKGGETVSGGSFMPEGWYKASIPCTVLGALVKNRIYPDPRIGLNSYRIPDSSDEFNKKYDLAKYSHLPDKRNPWRDPYWYRTEFDIPESMRGKHVWLLFKGINYRADVWLNGRQIAERETMAGMYQRFFLDAGMARPGSNFLAVKVYPVDHPGTPGSQLKVFGSPREFLHNDIMKDVTFNMSVGYDCMLPQPDRNMGLWQGVSLRFTGPVDIRNPFVVTDLPLPETKPARLTISTELVNATAGPQSGVLSGTVPSAGVTFEKAVTLGPRETKEVTFSDKEFPQLIISDPRLWWPAGYGEQPLYDLALEFRIKGVTSAQESTTFGIRKITKELYVHQEWPGLRVHINGQKVFSRGGWLQPDLLFDWDLKRIEAEVRYLVHANFTTVTFEDLPMPPDEFLEACDRHGLLFWNCFYGSLWASPTAGWDEFPDPPTYKDNPFKQRYAKSLPPERYTNYPLDHDLLERCTVDIIKRFRNHPSLIVYSCMGEGNPGKDVYERWRKQVRALDPTRLSIISADLKYRLPWLDEDWPTGVDDAASSKIRELKDYYEHVRGGEEWMFSTEIPFLASLPPVDSLRRFIPDLWDAQPGPVFPLNATWAHHGANSYFKNFDTFSRRMYGEPENLEDYCMKGHLVTAEHHRAVSEAVNHRLWDITSGSWEWKVNSSFPDVQWQIYDWYLRPMVSLYYYRLAFEPLHLQYSYLDRKVTLLNQTLKPQADLEAQAQLYDLNGKLLWENKAPAQIAPNTYADLFSVPALNELTPVYFLRLVLKGSFGGTVSRNFYWLSTADAANFMDLMKLPAVRLDVDCATVRGDLETVTTVRLKNATDQVAFFTHVALLRAEHGEEVLPVRWDDNYFSLVPGESREVRAIHATADLKGVIPTVDVNGWNVLSPFECTALRISDASVKIGEMFRVSARIGNTSLDGSLVQVLVDGKPARCKRIWGRGGASRDVDFQLWIDTPGIHTLQVGEQKATIDVRG